MRIGIPKERINDETRVAVTPKAVEQLLKLGFTVAIEHGAGELANLRDELFIKAGAKIVDEIEVWQSSIILKVNAPKENEIALLHPRTTLISFIWPAQNPELMNKLAARGINVISMDSVPRISSAQSIDALSSMANIAGYRAVIESAYQFGRFFTGQITAAGKIPPAKVIVIGAGVAGLAAMSTAKSLGAIVYAYDTRPETEEQVKSVGAKFLKLKFENIAAHNGKNCTGAIFDNSIKIETELLFTQIKEADIIITTALVPGKTAPKLITFSMVDNMKPGSVIVDLAIQNGGNCECTVENQIVVTANNVKIIGYTDLPRRLPNQSSQLYSTNIVNLVKLMCKNRDGNIKLDFEDAIIRNVTVIHEGRIIWPVSSFPSFEVAVQPKKETKDEIPSFSKTIKEEKPVYLLWYKYIFILLITFLFSWLVGQAPKEFLSHLTVFALSCVVGYYVVWNVSPALHTPLISVTNAISGIIIVGSLLQIGYGGWISLLSFIAILITSINIFGGFTATQRMLKMFRKE